MDAQPAAEQRYSFMERLELYKLAKKPRKQVRLKFDVIQKDALPFLSTQQHGQHELRGLRSFVRGRSHIVHPKGKGTLPTIGQQRNSLNSSLEICQEENLVRTLNEYYNTRDSNRRALATMDINVKLKEISNQSLRKYNEVVERAVDYI